MDENKKSEIVDESVDESKADGSVSNSPVNKSVRSLTTESVVAESALAESRKTYEDITKKGSKTKRIGAAILFAVNILAIAIIAIIEFGGEQEITPFNEVFDTWVANWKYLCCIGLAVLLFYLTDTMRISLFLKRSTKKFRPLCSAKASVIGKYYDNITPFGSGGQAFQMYYLSKHVPIGAAASAPIMNMMLAHVAFAVIAIVSFSVYPDAVSNVVKVPAYFGVFLYLLVPVAALLFSLTPKFISKLLGLVLRIGVKIKIVKDYDKTYNKYYTNLTDYCSVLVSTYKSVGTMIFTFILSLINYVALLSIPYFVVKACGVQDVSFVHITVLTTYVYAAITFVPTPGNTGAAEGTFYAIFSILQGGFLFWGMMLWRFAVFYLTIILGLIILFYDYIVRYKRIQKLSSGKHKHLPKTPED